MTKYLRKPSAFRNPPGSGEFRKPPASFRDSASVRQPSLRPAGPSRGRRLAALLLCLALLAVGAGAALLLGSVSREAAAGAPAEDTAGSGITDASGAGGGDAGGLADLSGLTAQSALLLSLDSGEVLGEKAASEPMDPAGLTAVMAAWTALGLLDGENPSVTLPKSLFERVLLQGAATAGFLPGEEVTASDLLGGALLLSGAEAALGLAQAAAGSEEGLTAAMNQEAARLGMDGTNFTNVTGWADLEQTATAEDLGRFLSAAWDEEGFRQVFCARSVLVGPTNRHPEGLRLANPVYSLAGQEPEGVSLLGAKAGAAPADGGSGPDAGEEGSGLWQGYFLGVAEAGGQRLLLVLLGVPGDSRSGALAVQEAMAVYTACAEAL